MIGRSCERAIRSSDGSRSLVATPGMGAVAGVARSIRDRTATRGLLVLFCLVVVLTAAVPRDGFAAAPPGVVFVTERYTNRVSVIDVATDEVCGRIDVGRGPSGLVLDEAARRLYVALESCSNHLAVIDVDSWQAVALTVPGMGRTVIGVDITPDGRTLLATTRGQDGKQSADDTLDFLSVDSTNWPPEVSFVTNLLTGVHPINVTVGHNGQRAVVTVRNEPAILIVDLSTRTVLAEAPNLPANAQPEGSALHPLTNIVYVTLHGPQSTVEVIDLDRAVFLAHVPIIHTPPAQPSSGVFTPDGTRFFVSGQSVDKVFMFDTSNPTNPVQDMTVGLKVGRQPHFIAFLPDGRAYVADTNNTQPTGDIAVINGYASPTPSVGGRILPTLAEPLRVAYVTCRPTISALAVDSVEARVNLDGGQGLTYRLMQRGGLNGTGDWHSVTCWQATSNGPVVLSAPRSNVVDRMFYRCTAEWLFGQ